MTIFNGSKVPNGSSNPDRLATANPPENMSDRQIPIGNLMISNDQDDEDKDCVFIFPESVNTIGHHEMIYDCVFHLEPDMLKYYYSPPPIVISRSLDGKPVPMLQGSSEFSGFYDTKWQVSVNFNRWIGRHRWMSIYLSRVDKNPVQMQAQFEFQLVDKNGLKVFSQRNNFFLTKTIPGGLSVGFEKFLPFSEVTKYLIDGDKLKMKLNLLLICTQIGYFENATAQTQQVSQSQGSNSLKKPNDIQGEIADFFYCPPDLTPEEIPQYFLLGNFNSHIPVDCRTEIQLNGLRVGYADRKKLKEKSPVYVQCIQNKWNCMDLVNLALFSRDLPVKQIRAVRECINYIHGERCAILENGSYRDAQVLLQLAIKLGTEDLIRRCLTFMTYKVNLENATDFSMIVEKYCEFLNQDEFTYFQKFFRDYFSEIRKTLRFQELKRIHSPWLIRSLFE